MVRPISDEEGALPSPAHEQLVSALTATGRILTPTIAPHGQELATMRRDEVATTQVASSQERIVADVRDGVECLTVGDAPPVGSPCCTFTVGVHLHQGGRCDRHGCHAGAHQPRPGCPSGYRRAPEFPYPAAVDDGLTVYRDLVNSGVDPRHIVVGGDSAGGGSSWHCSSPRSAPIYRRHVRVSCSRRGPI